MASRCPEERDYRRDAAARYFFLGTDLELFHRHGAVIILVKLLHEVIELGIADAEDIGVQLDERSVKLLGLKRAEEFVMIPERDETKTSKDHITHRDLSIAVLVEDAKDFLGRHALLLRHAHNLLLLDVGRRPRRDTVSDGNEIRAHVADRVAGERELLVGVGAALGLARGGRGLVRGLEKFTVLASPHRGLFLVAFDIFPIVRGSRNARRPRHFTCAAGLELKKKIYGTRRRARFGKRKMELQEEDLRRVRMAGPGRLKNLLAR